MLRIITQGTHAILVLDGAGGHAFMALQVPDIITLLPLPPDAPEVTPIASVRADRLANRLAIARIRDLRGDRHATPRRLDRLRQRHRRAVTSIPMRTSPPSQ